MTRRPKTFDQRREELKNALTQISNAIYDYERTGQLYPLTIVAVQLRALIIYVPNSGSLKHPLLLELAQERNFPLIVYAPDPAYRAKIFNIAQPIAYSTGDPCTIAQDEMYPIETTLEKVMEEMYIFVSNKNYTLKELIRLIADTEATHYDPSRPMVLDDLDSFEIGGLSSGYRAIYSLGKVVRDLGQRFTQAAI